MNSHLQTPETFWLCNQVLGIQGKHNISPKLANPTTSCIHPSTHNQETFGNRLPQPSKKHPLYKSWQYSCTRHSTGLSGLSHQQLYKRDFRCRRTKLRYSKTATIKLLRQHLGAQLPGTPPLNPW